MQFTQIPQQFASIEQELAYVIEQENPGNIDVRIYDSESGDLIGSKRFAETTRAEFDIAPRLRQHQVFTPSTGGTGFKSASGRTICSRLIAFETGSEVAGASSELRHAVPGDFAEPASRIQTTMPSERLIPEGACDELTLLMLQTETVTVTAPAGDTTIAESFQPQQTGVWLFRLDTRDFPGCETITVDAGSCGSVRYTVVPARQNGVRIAWKSHAGSIEHYSFPVVRSTTFSISKQRAEGVDGHLVTAADTAREMILVSAYESQEILEALAEAASSPEVWFADGDTYTPADVLTEEAVVQRHGLLCSLELTIRPKNDLSWN